LNEPPHADDPGADAYVFALGMAKVITLYAGWETAFSLTGILVAFGTSASVDLLFGLFPARRAAQLDPVQALRFE
jgi:ABC-type antimicrobial peptide transport system permease subunit